MYDLSYVTINIVLINIKKTLLCFLLTYMVSNISQNYDRFIHCPVALPSAAYTCSFHEHTSKNKRFTFSYKTFINNVKHMSSCSTNGKPSNLAGTQKALMKNHEDTQLSVTRLSPQNHAKTAMRNPRCGSQTKTSHLTLHAHSRRQFSPFLACTTV